MTPVPNFFIVGAPKSATTSLDHYLSQHPDVFMGAKDSRFFAPDMSSLLNQKIEKDYLSLFQGYKGESRVGESSALYLYSKSAAVRIKRFAPNAKIIAILRNPADMIASLHSYFVTTGVENIKRLEDALEAESDRRNGKRIPMIYKYPHPKELLQYRDIGKYTEQLNRFFSEFGRENVHVIIFDDFRRNTEGEFAKVCEFLGIASDYRPEFTIENPAKMPRCHVLHRTWYRVRPLLHPSTKWLKPIIPSLLRKLLWRLYDFPMKLNLVTRRRSPIHEETRKELVQYYEREVESLEMLLDRDLSCWRAENVE